MQAIVDSPDLDLDLNNKGNKGNKGGSTVEVTCEFCGTTYGVTKDEIQTEILDKDNEDDEDAEDGIRVEKRE